MSHRASSLFLLAVALAAPAAGSRPARIETLAAASAPLRLVEPAPGAVWRTGEPATLAWAPGPGFERASGLEEWEVFYSVDGGATYPVRLTPHLDLSRRHVEIRVPDLPTENGRLLLRAGDEREELAIEVPLVLRVVAGEGAAATGGATALRRLSLAPGEAARGDGRPTLIWTDGSRDGAGWREREAALSEPDSLSAGLAPAPTILFLPAPGRAAPDLLSPVSVPDLSARPGAEAEARPSAPARSRPILLLSSRRNE